MYTNVPIIVTLLFWLLAGEPTIEINSGEQFQNDFCFKDVRDLFILSPSFPWAFHGS